MWDSGANELTTRWSKPLAAGTLTAGSMTLSGDNLDDRENEDNSHAGGSEIVLTEWFNNGPSSGDDEAAYTGSGGLVDLDGLPVAAFAGYPITFA